MRKLRVFNNVSLDGYFVDSNGDMSWAKKSDEEFNAFVQDNAKSGGEMLFGRITYEMMSSFWPTTQAMEAHPIVAKTMNEAPKVVFSRSLKEATWKNTRVITGDLDSEVRRLKNETGKDMVIFGSGQIVSHLTELGLIDEYQFVVTPVVLGRGRTLFAGIHNRLNLKTTKTRVFKNGSLYLCFERCP